MSDTQSIGILGENLAVDKLREEGYSILERNWRCGRYETDIIALKYDTVCFVEVKTRSTTGWTSPESAMTYAKGMALRRGAQAYLSSRRLWDYNIRFDLMAVDIYPDGHHEIRHYEDAVQFHW